MPRSGSDSVPALPSGMCSYKVRVRLQGDPHWYVSQRRFGTYEQARKHRAYIRAYWLWVTDTDVTPSEEAPNQRE